MAYIDLTNPTDIDLLASLDIQEASFKKTLAIIDTISQEYIDLSQKHQHFFKMAVTSDMMLESYAPYKNLPLKEKQEWREIKNIKTGDRGFICRGLLSVIKEISPTIFNETINPRFQARTAGGNTDPMELNNELDALILSVSVPAYYEYLEKLMVYKNSVYSGLKRGFANFIEARSIHIITGYLKAIETDSEALGLALFNQKNVRKLEKMGEVISKYCERIDPNHHDMLSLSSKNNLRSQYVSLFNSSMTWLTQDKEVPLEIRHILPLIPDRLSFIRSDLEYDNAWTRYQDHHFLFMRLTKEKKQNLMDHLSQMTVTEKVGWMGCLGEDEINAMVLPMLSQQSRFENLATSCKDIAPENPEFVFTKRVWNVLNEIYVRRLKKLPSTPDRIHLLFGYHPPGTSDGQPALATNEGKTEEADLSELRALTFLVIDDSERIRKMTISVLNDVGVTKIFEAENGKIAWELIKTNPMDVILCDWIMPEMSGIELVQKMMQVESLASQTAFLMLTTVDDKMHIVEALSVGVRGYLIKPFTKKQLLEKVYFATEWLRKERQEGKIPIRKNKQQ